MHLYIFGTYTPRLFSTDPRCSANQRRNRSSARGYSPCFPQNTTPRAEKMLPSTVDGPGLLEVEALRLTFLDQAGLTCSRRMRPAQNMSRKETSHTETVDDLALRGQSHDVKVLLLNGMRRIVPQRHDLGSPLRESVRNTADRSSPCSLIFRLAEADQVKRACGCLLGPWHQIIAAAGTEFLSSDAHCDMIEMNAGQASPRLGRYSHVEDSVQITPAINNIKTMSDVPMTGFGIGEECRINASINQLIGSMISVGLTIL
ncbi:hypothetical protein AC579_536 [Pseudocercospora musae]|uniref:Uncharacterized protein n=1 Tax=Pseudocercospora musae TaxID=113226 RepID=A0A139IR86_9PEZI|nr:hypothetical protein AC579_536 [Pseudocercospora musae]